MSTKMNNNKIKYLLEALEQKKREILMPKNELKLLLSDIEAAGSKWKDQDRVGQAQLYEAAEFVLNNLKGYTPYSEPFQRKVTPKEAPDYHKVIEHPMDLGQIFRKLRQHEYNNKQEFSDDLYLIYSNCLRYNTNPEHIFREYARAMKEKTDELLEKVPDITIQSREEFLASVDQEQEDEQKINQPITESQPVTENQQVADSLVLIDEAQEENSQDLHDINVPVPDEEQVGNDSIISSESDNDEEAEIERELQEILSNFDMPKFPDLWDPEIDNPDRDKFFEPGYDPSANNPTLDQYPQLQFPKRGTALMIENNIQTLKRSRILHSKLMAARQNIPLSHLGITETAPEEQITQIKPNIDPRNLPPLMLNSEGAFESTKRVVAKLCQHAGFEATSHTALTILTEVAQDYFLNLGKTLRTYIDDYGKKMTPEEIVTHTLYENGVTSINKLESYVKNDIIRYGSKLRDIHNRLETTYKEALASPENHETEEESFPDSEDAFMMGNFGEDLGDDFFGFRELGLGSLVIPQRLFLGTNKPKPQIKKTNEETRKKSRYEPPPPWEPINDPDSQIGLLREFFRNNMEESGGKLIEDEFLPVKQRNQRPKVPPTGKIPPQSKRLLKPQLTAAALLEKKRKRERDAQIAEEKERAKRIKAEERAKKQAEKEEAKRLKQLEREAAKKAEMEAKEQRKAEQEHQKRLAQEAKEARKAEAEAAKKAAMENKKRKTSTKTGKSKTPQSEVSSTPVSRKLEPDDGSDSEMVPLAQRKKRRAESSGRTGNKRPTN
ncbi:hypothetical protein Glove_203g56 [Diversispora epigaea]|uniref:Bromo domain-containing protein n=1 Tax=Diversispora epigaea TaxID=1348612 RepID=A0A397ISQ1_9GLOM|nr:hypothetical protein Glove_203g56 [Diversispora epigaea]